MSLSRRVLALLSALLLTTGLAVAQAGPAQADPLQQVWMHNVHSGKAMVVSGASHDLNAAVVQWYSNTRAPDNDKIWMRPSGTGPNEYFLQAMHSYKCLVVQNASFALNARIIQHQCTANDRWNNDIWIMETVYWQGNTRYPHWRNKDTGLCIVVYGAGTHNGAQLIQHHCNGGANTLWSPSYSASTY